MLIEDIFRQIVLSLALVAAASAQWPAGVSPAACPNYPYCNEAAAPVAAPVAYAAAAALPADPALRYPAGVSAASCPNYPDCFQGRNYASVSLPILRAGTSNKCATYFQNMRFACTWESLLVENWGGVGLCIT